MCTIGTAESSAYKRYSNFSVEVFFENFIDLKISDQWRTWNINRKKKAFSIMLKKQMDHNINIYDVYTDFLNRKVQIIRSWVKQELF